MPISVNLIENGHILWFQIEGAWKPEDIAPAKEKTQRIFKAAQHPIHPMIDLSHASVNLPLLKASNEVLGGEPLPNVGQIAVVGVPRLIRMVAEPILRASGNKDPLNFFNTVDDAKRFLRQHINDSPLRQA